MENTSRTPQTRVSPQKQGCSIATLLIGIWLFIASFALASTKEGMLNSIVIGVLLFICSGLRLRKGSSFLWSCANVIFGFWMLLGPRPLVFGSTPFRWSDFALGWATVVLSIMAACGHDRVLGREEVTVQRVSLPGHQTVA